MIVTAASANLDIVVGSGTDTGDFRIYDGTTNWLLIDEDADTLAMGAAADAGITIGGGSVASVTLSTDGTGNAELALPEDSVGPTELEDNGVTLDAGEDEYCLTYEVTGGIFEWQSCGGGGGAWSDLTNPTGALSLTFDDTEVNTFAFSHTVGDQNFLTFDVNQVDDAAATDDLDVIKLALTSESGDAGDTFEGIVIEWEEGTANTIMDAGIRINNLETTASTLIDAIIVQSTGVSGGVIDGLDVSDGNITNAINIGANAIAGTNFSVTGAGVVTAAGAIAANGGITFDNSTDTLGAFTAGGTIDFGDNVAVNLGASGTDFSGSGGLTLADALSVTTGGVSITEGALVVNSDSITSDGALTIDASDSVILGGGGNTYTFDESSGPVYAGTARPTKRITISPEYPGATLTGDGGSNTGTMTSDSMTSTPYRNYYNWANTQGTVQDYDIWVRVPLPADFSEMAGTKTLSIDTYSSDLTNGTVAVTVYDTSNSADCTSATFTPTGSIDTWESKTSTTCLDTGTYTANGIVTIQLKIQGAATTGNTRVSDIYFDYLAKF